jgi:glucokinase
MADPTLAIDIGGTKIAAGLVDEDGELVHHAQLPTPDNDAEAIWAVVDSLVTEALAAAGGHVRSVGIASAGPIDLPTGTISPINITAWQRFPIVERVSGLGMRRCGWAATASAWRSANGGAARAATRNSCSGWWSPLASAAGWCSTARLTTVAPATPDVGHVVVEPDGAPHVRGRGCVETIAAGPHMAQWAREQGWDAPAEADAKELADAANAGDPVALRAFRRGAGAVAAMIASVGAVCDLDLVVVGGGVAKSGALLFDPLRQALAVHARLAFLRGLRVVPAELGGDAGLVGAAALLDSAHS